MEVAGEEEEEKGERGRRRVRGKVLWMLNDGETGPMALLSGAAML